MENNMKVFENKEFGFVRTVMIGNEPWFVGKDVAAALGYKNPQEAVRTHIFDEDKGVSEILTPGGTQKLTVINESGLYSLILASKIPSARAFKKWVASEILPTIRRHGAYISDPLMQKMADNPGAPPSAILPRLPRRRTILFQTRPPQSQQHPPRQIPLFRHCSPRPSRKMAPPGDSRLLLPRPRLSARASLPFGRRQVIWETGGTGETRGTVAFEKAPQNFYEGDGDGYSLCKSICVSM